MLLRWAMGGASIGAVIGFFWGVWDWIKVGHGFAELIGSIAGGMIGGAIIIGSAAYGLRKFIFRTFWT